MKAEVKTLTVAVKGQSGGDNRATKHSHHHVSYREKTSTSKGAKQAKVPREHCVPQDIKVKAEDSSITLFSSSNSSSAQVKKRKRRKRARSNVAGSTVTIANGSGAKLTSTATVVKDKIAKKSKLSTKGTAGKEKKKKGRKRTRTKGHQVLHPSSSDQPVNEAVKEKMMHCKKRCHASQSRTLDGNTGGSLLKTGSEPNIGSAKVGGQTKDQSLKPGNIKTDKKKRRHRKRRQGKAGATHTKLAPAEASSKERTESAATEDDTLEPLKKRAKLSKASSVPLSSMEVRGRALEMLRVAQFRLLNEDLYTSTGTEAEKTFKEDPQAFQSYHEGFEKQVAKWPVNPVDVIVESLKKLPKSTVIADMGCGDAKIAQTLTNKIVHSFDLVALNDHVTQCDMSKVPLQNNSVHVVVFCLSLMGTNLNSFILEANRILKQQGILKIAEVESRFDDVDHFVKVMTEFGFLLVSQDDTNKMFILFEFKKVRGVKRSPKLPIIRLKPCLYKKR